MTIDLSNDPDIKKFFDSDNEQEKEANRTVESEASQQLSPHTANLIDILSEISTPVSTSTSACSSLTTQSAPQPTQSHQAFTITPLKPSSSTGQLEAGSLIKQPADQKSILNEFDPLNEPATVKHSQQVTTTVSSNLINFNSPRPFQMPVTSTQFRPNYNISLPPVGPSPSIPQSQSLHSIRNPAQSVLYAPRPFYLSSSQSMRPVLPVSSPHYRPVHFPVQSQPQLRPSISNTSSSFDFLGYPPNSDKNSN